MAIRPFPTNATDRRTVPYGAWSVDGLDEMSLQKEAPASTKVRRLVGEQPFDFAQTTAFRVGDQCDQQVDQGQTEVLVDVAAGCERLEAPQGGAGATTQHREETAAIVDEQ